MADKLKRTLSLPILFSGAGLRLTRLLTKSLAEELNEEATDKFLELLLSALDWAFCLCKDYRKNIEDFKGRYLFKTADNKVAVAAVFEGGNMEVIKEPQEGEYWDVKIIFKNTVALKSFIFSQDQDILNSLLKNEVEVDGNLNYIYKFGFMARDLSRRLGVVHPPQA